MVKTHAKSVRLSPPTAQSASNPSLSPVSDFQLAVTVLIRNSTARRVLRAHSGTRLVWVCDGRRHGSSLLFERVSRFPLVVLFSQYWETPLVLRAAVEEV